MTIIQSTQVSGGGVAYAINGAFTPVGTNFILTSAQYAIISGVQVTGASAGALYIFNPNVGQNFIFPVPAGANLYNIHIPPGSTVTAFTSADNGSTVAMVYTIFQNT